MARPSSRESLPDRLLPSLLDRLAPSLLYNKSEANLDGYSLDDMYRSVHRDLLALLNTHAPPMEPSEDCTLLRRSIAVYGLPDLTTLAMMSERGGVAVSMILEDILSRFEPRLSQIRVIPVPDPDSAKQFLMRFQIEARLSVDPYPQVAYQTVYDLATGKTSITAED
jgi:type VI secretion system protein ImpF